METNKKNWLKYTLFTFAAIFSRLAPHLPNVTAIGSLGILGDVYTSRKSSVIMTFISLFLSDIALHFMLGYPLYGYFSIFTYSGFLLPLLFSFSLKGGPLIQLTKRCILFTLFFFLWSNLGTFINSNLYPFTIEGLTTCYFMALPFCLNQFMGNIVWTFAFFLINKIFFVSSKAIKSPAQ